MSRDEMILMFTNMIDEAWLAGWQEGFNHREDEDEDD